MLRFSQLQDGASRSPPRNSTWSVCGRNTRAFGGGSASEILGEGFGRYIVTDAVADLDGDAALESERFRAR